MEDARNQGRRHHGRHSGRQTHDDPRYPVDDRDSQHPTRTWHKVTPTPTPTPAVSVVVSAVSDVAWQVEQDDRGVLSSLSGDLVSQIDE